MYQFPAPCALLSRLTLVSSFTYRVQDATQQQCSKVSIRTLGRDVVVLAIASANHLNVSELSIVFVHGKSFKFIAVHKIAKALGPGLDHRMTLLML